MNKKNLLIAAFYFLTISTSAQNSTLVTGDEDVFPKQETTGEIHLSPGIESILYNPEVKKEQKSGKLIQATGFRNTDDKHFIIHFRNAKLHGGWETFFDNNQLCDSGRLEKNIPDGEWKTWYPDGKLKSIRTYSAKKYHYIKADLKRNHPKDQRYQITRYASSNYSVSKYFLPAYQSSIIYPGLPILQKITFNTTQEGANYLAPFDNCMHHGLFINYNKNGLLTDSGTYVNGLKHDIWRETSADGNRRGTGFYSHGRRHGQWKFYDPNGNLIYTESYDYGKKTSSFYFRNQ